MIVVNIINNNKLTSFVNPIVWSNNGCSNGVSTAAPPAPNETTHFGLFE